MPARTSVLLALAALLSASSAQLTPAGGKKPHIGARTPPSALSSTALLVRRAPADTSGRIHQHGRARSSGGAVRPPTPKAVPQYTVCSVCRCRVLQFSTWLMTGAGQMPAGTPTRRTRRRSARRAWTRSSNKASNCAYAPQAAATHMPCDMQLDIIIITIRVPARRAQGPRLQLPVLLADALLTAVWSLPKPRQRQERGRDGLQPRRSSLRLRGDPQEYDRYRIEAQGGGLHDPPSGQVGRGHGYLGPYSARPGLRHLPRVR